MATPKMNRDWTVIRDRIKSMWSDVDFDDKRLKKTRGSLRRMVSLVQDRTDEPRSQIRRKIVACM